MRGYEITAPTSEQVARLDKLAATPGSGIAKFPDGGYRLTEPVEVRFSVDRYFELHPNIKPDDFYIEDVITYRQEFTRQLDMQETGLNDLTVAEWRHNVSEYGPASSAEKAAHAKARSEAEEAAVQAGMPVEDTALLHGPDRVGGGRPDAWDGLGHRGINSSIGRQWQDRIRGLRTTVDGVVDNTLEPDPELLKFVRLNVRLVPS